MRLFALALVLFLSSCATLIPVSYEEYCAQKGLELAGTESVSGTETAAAFSGPYSAHGVSNFQGESISCVMPKTEVRKCEIGVLRETLEPVTEYNSSVPQRRVLTGVGYFFYIIPGVIGAVTSDNAKEKAKEEYRRRSYSQRSCESSIVAGDTGNL